MMMLMIYDVAGALMCLVFPMLVDIACFVPWPMSFVCYLKWIWPCLRYQRINDVLLIVNKMTIS